MEIAETLPQEGVIKAIGNYCFLKIHDDYIYKLFPLLNSPEGFSIPDYFENPGDIGAHISVIYPEENIKVKPEDLKGKHHFNLLDLCQARLGQKEYLVLLIACPSLEGLREQYGLAKNPVYKGAEIRFHITIGTRLMSG